MAGKIPPQFLKNAKTKAKPFSAKSDGQSDESNLPPWLRGKSSKGKGKTKTSKKDVEKAGRKKALAKLSSKASKKQSDQDEDE